MSNMNVLICMQQMGIGGVETVVLNQIQLLKKQNYNVFIVGKFGIYTQKYIEYGAKCIEFDFKLQKYYEKDSIKEIENIIEEYKINAVYIHSSECIPYVFPLCVHYKIPYVAYIHGGYKEVYQWYINNYFIFKMYFPLYFKYAYKNVCITNKVKENIMKMFGLENDKNFVIFPNSINFNNILKNETEKNNKSKLLILSRLSKEKEQSIINAITFFERYNQVLPESTLTIVGTGNAEKEIREYVEKLDLKEKIKFLGESDDVYSVIKEHDIVLGMGRGILETIAMKKIAIISGYKKITGIVKQNNIEDACEENFTDRYEQEEDVLDKLIKMNDEELEEIVNKNYKFCYEKCNAETNFIYIDAQKKVDYGNKTLDEVLTLNCELANFYEKEIFKRDETIEEIYVTNVLLKKEIEQYKQKEEINKLKEKTNEENIEQKENINLEEKEEIITKTKKKKYFNLFRKDKKS